jgi:DNA-binding GntR family transcriptional regulator
MGPSPYTSSHRKRVLIKSHQKNILKAIKHHDDNAAVQARKAHLLVARNNLIRSANMLQE